MFNVRTDTSDSSTQLAPKLRKITHFASMLVFTIVFLTAGPGDANAEYYFDSPVNLGPNINTAYDEVAPCISADSLELYFSDTPFLWYPAGQGGQDIWVAKRLSIDQPWDVPVNLGPAVNSPNHEGVPRISSDGLSLYFCSYRASGNGGYDIYVTTRPSTSGSWDTPVNIGPPVNTFADEGFVSISADSLELYFSEYQVLRPGGLGDRDIWVARRGSPDDPWGTPVNLGFGVNTGYADTHPFISDDGLSLFFVSDRPGGFTRTGWDIWVTTRKTVSDSWITPVNLGPIVNYPDSDSSGLPYLSRSVLYFNVANVAGGYGRYDLYQASIIYIPQCGDTTHPYPPGDVNHDCRVDLFDIAIVCSHWLEDNNPQ